MNSDIINLNNVDNFNIKANHTLIERAIFNIISNANKYAKQKVTIKDKKPGNQLILAIDDDGPGFPVSERKLVLKPFYRTHKSRSRSTGGVGLGLAIAEIVVKDSEGEIVIGENDLGGTRVELLWPLTS